MSMYYCHTNWRAVLVRPCWLACVRAPVLARPGPEPGQGAAFAGVVERDLDRQADREFAVAQLAAVGRHDVGHQPRAFLKLDVGEHIRPAVPVRALAPVVDRVAVDAAPAGHRLPPGARAAAVRAEGPRVPDQAGAVLALLNQQLAAGGRGP